MDCLNVHHQPTEEGFGRVRPLLDVAARRQLRAADGPDRADDGRAQRVRLPSTGLHCHEVLPADV